MKSESNLFSLNQWKELTSPEVGKVIDGTTLEE